MSRFLDNGPFHRGVVTKATILLANLNPNFTIEKSVSCSIDGQINLNNPCTEVHVDHSDFCSSLNENPSNLD